MAKVKPEVAERIRLLTPRFGRPGSPIPGSRYVRWYCQSCGEPMRVTRDPWPPTYLICEVCGDRHGYVPERKAGPIDDVGGYQANAIRAMEGD